MASYLCTSVSHHWRQQKNIRVQNQSIKAGPISPRCASQHCWDYRKQSNVLGISCPALIVGAHTDVIKRAARASQVVSGCISLVQVPRYLGRYRGHNPFLQRVCPIISRRYRQLSDNNHSTLRLWIGQRPGNVVDIPTGFLLIKQLDSDGPLTVDESDDEATESDKPYRVHHRRRPSIVSSYLTTRVERC